MSQKFHIEEVSISQSRFLVWPLDNVAEEWPAIRVSISQSRFLVWPLINGCLVKLRIIIVSISQSRFLVWPHRGGLGVIVTNLSFNLAIEILVWPPSTCSSRTSMLTSFNLAIEIFGLASRRLSKDDALMLPVSISQSRFLVWPPH